MGNIAKLGLQKFCLFSDSCGCENGNKLLACYDMLFASVPAGRPHYQVHEFPSEEFYDFKVITGELLNIEVDLMRKDSTG